MNSISSINGINGMNSMSSVRRMNSMPDCIVALDVGTTNVKAYAFDAGSLNAEKVKVLLRVSFPLSKSFPKGGFVEQDPREMISLARRALQTIVVGCGAAARGCIVLGITNQRETTIVWDRESGAPIYPAIVWEDARTADECAALERAYGSVVREKTGLPVDSYFSAAKIRWILDRVPRARARAEKRELCFGTVDSWILWNLAAGQPHATDYTNASRTLLFNIREKRWDDELLSMFKIPRAILPEVRPSISHFGILRSGLFPDSKPDRGTPAGVGTPILAVSGDQQASLFAAGAETGTTKITFGTGIFAMQVVGNDFRIQPPFFTTLSAEAPRPSYALEAKIESCAERVTPLIGREKEMNALLDEFAEEVARAVELFPIRPAELVIDGGVTQAPHLREAVRRAVGLPVRQHSIFDGTALGVARLARASAAALNLVPR